MRTESFFVPFFLGPALLVATISLTPLADAQSGRGSPVLTYIPGSSVKLYQVNGDCDWAEWDATITNKAPTCTPTASRAVTNADVLGDDVPVAFEHNGELIVTFGDTIGAAGNSAWTNVQNSFQWHAHDPIAHSTTANAADGLLLKFFLNGNHGLEVLPPPQPGGTPVDMGVDNVPHAGVSLNGTIYLGIKTGTVSSGNGNNDQSHDYSVLATFDETTSTFTSGRTISTLPNGHFVGPTFYLAPAGVLGTPPPVSPEPVVLIFGVGEFRSSNVYLSIIPSTEFASGVDQNGNSATRYFSGMSNGQPTWSSSESSAVPIVTDVDPANPTISNTSIFYSQPLGLWLMVYDGGRGSPSTEACISRMLRSLGVRGVRLSSASTPAATKHLEISCFITIRLRLRIIAPAPCLPGLPPLPTPLVRPVPPLARKTIPTPLVAPPTPLPSSSVSPSSPAAL